MLPNSGRILSTGPPPFPVHLSRWINHTGYFLSLRAKAGCHLKDFKNVTNTLASVLFPEWFYEIHFVCPNAIICQTVSPVSRHKLFSLPVLRQPVISTSISCCVLHVWKAKSRQRPDSGLQIVKTLLRVHLGKRLQSATTKSSQISLLGWITVLLHATASES